MDENEIKAVTEALEELRKGGTVSAETLEKLGGTTQSANKALAGYTQKLLGATGSLAGMGKAVADGEGSFKSLGSSITGLTGMIGNLASAIPLVGGAAKALAEGVGQAAKFVLDQLDTMARNYQTLGDASAGAADGVDGLLRQFNQLGNYSLPAFTKAVKNNTLGLAAFQGTAAAGAEELSKVSGALTTGQTAQRFLKLGMSLDAVGDATTAYLADSARYGITQGQSTEELTKKTQNYIVEVDKIARLTGQTREAQAKEAQKSLADARFRAKLADMTANGQEQQAEELRKYVEGLGGAAGDAARALVTGIPLTKDAASANLFANDAIRQNTLAIQEGKKATEAISETQQALADGTVRFGKQIQYGGDVFGGVAVQAFDTAAILKEQNKLMSTGMTREQAIEAIQKKQMNASGKNTEAFTKAQLATADASKNLQSLGFSLAEAAIPAVEKFANVLDETTGFIAKKFGVGGTVMKREGVDHGKAGGAAGEKYANSLLELIGRGESKGNYNALVYGKKGANTPKEADLTNMTVAEVQEYQKGMIGKGHASTAVGKYQMIASTLAEQVKKAGLDPNKTKFDQKTQDLLAKQLIEQAGYGKKDTATVMKNLAGTWASLPKDMSGKGAYDNDANRNQAGINPQELLAAIKDPNGLNRTQATDGNVPSADMLSTTGPTTRYKPYLNGASPTAMGVDSRDQAQQTTPDKERTLDTDKLSKQLAEISQTQKNLLEVNKKILARQS